MATGRTLGPLLDLLRRGGARRVRTVVLLDKTERREVPVEVDYVGFEVPDRWVVGYGLDDEERYRDLPDIRWIEP